MKIALVAATAVLVGGCAGAMKQQAAGSSDSVVCAMTIMATTRDRQAIAEAEKARRGLTCTPEMMAAGREAVNGMRDRNARQSEALGAAGAALLIRPPADQIRPGTHTYYINGKYVTCTTTGTITNCF